MPKARPDNYLAKPQIEGYATAFTELQREWTTMWTKTIPEMASSLEWPTRVDHSVARVILDNAVGVEKPWTEVVKSPATANMSEAQLQACIDLANEVLSGKTDIWELQTKSLALRGMKAEDDSRRKAVIPSSPVTGTKRKRRPSTSDKNQTSKQRAAHGWTAYSLTKTHIPSSISEIEECEILPDIQLILHSAPSLTPFKRHALLLLTEVPRGRFTTYQAIADAMGKGNGRSVGECMRTNPFAPTVACHRMVSSDLRVGGWHGDWEKDGGFYREKRRLLEEEGVVFDEKDRVVGEVFRSFVEIERVT